MSVFLCYFWTAPGCEYTHVPCSPSCIYGGLSLVELVMHVDGTTKQNREQVSPSATSCSLKRAACGTVINAIIWASGHIVFIHVYMHVYMCTYMYTCVYWCGTHLALTGFILIICLMCTCIQPPSNQPTINQPTNNATHQPTNQPTMQPINQLSCALLG